FFTAAATAKGQPDGLPFFLTRSVRKAMERFFATCPRGLELLLAEELRVLGAEKVHAVGGGVQFAGTFSLCYRANLESRIASRGLWQVARADYRSEEDIYRAAYAPRWTDWLDSSRTIRVDLSATRSPLASLNFAGSRGAARASIPAIPTFPSRAISPRTSSRSISTPRASPSSSAGSGLRPARRR